MSSKWTWVADSILLPATDTGDGGAVNVDFPVVPAGYYYHVHSVVGRQADNAPSKIVFQVVRNTTVYTIGEDSSPAAAVYSGCSREIFLKAGDVLRVRFAGTTSTKALTCFMNARKIPAS